MGERKFVQIVQVTWSIWPPCPYMAKTLKIFFSLRNQKTDDLETWYAASGARVLSSLFKWWPWVDLYLLNGKVKFALLCVCIGTFFNSRFPRNYWSLWSERWHMKSTKWVYKDLRVPMVKVIHWPSSEVTQISSISNASFKPMSRSKPNFMWSL